MRYAAMGLAVLLTGCAAIGTRPSRPSQAIEDLFLAPPGTIIRASREEGLRALMHLARTQRDEVCILYLPDEGIWVTHMTERTEKSCAIDLQHSERYATTATGRRQELWHTHTEIGVDYQGDENANRFYWTVPSVTDLGQVYSRGETLPGVTGEIVTRYGALSYGSDSYPGGTVPIYLLYQALYDEAARLQRAFENGMEEELTTRAGAYRGIVRLRFETIEEMK